jgi:hypothetical protein
MTAKVKTSVVKTPSKKKEKSFSTVHETITHFFPKTQGRDGFANGEERGTEEAERVFSEITHSLLR